MAIQWEQKNIFYSTSQACKFAAVTLSSITLIVVGILANLQVQGLDNSIGIEGQWALIGSGASLFIIYSVGLYLHRNNTDNIEILIIFYFIDREMLDKSTNNEDSEHNPQSIWQKANHEITTIKKNKKAVVGQLETFIMNPLPDVNVIPKIKKDGFTTSRVVKIFRNDIFYLKKFILFKNDSLLFD